MAIVNFNKKLFEREIGKLNEKMQERITMFGTPLEAVTEDDVQVEIFPNRPDLLSFQGYSRAFLSFLGKKPGLKNYKVNKPEKEYKVIIDPSVKKIRPFTACAIVKNLKFDDEKIKEIVDIQEKIHFTLGRKRKKLAIGVYPLEKIALPITYKALEPDKIKFTPLEYDRELSGFEILQRHPAGREYAHLLTGKAKFPIFVDSNNNILSMPPIINSQLTGKITENTRDIFVECSGFDFNVLKKCLNIVVACLADMGGEVYSMGLIYEKKEITPDLEPEKMKINIEHVNKLLGVELNEKQVKSLLEKMGHDYNANAKTVLIPAWRVDVLHEVDLIEDIAIAYGYENFEPQIPQISTIGEENKTEIIKRKIAEILFGLGLMEVSNYHLTTKNDQFKKMGVQLKEGGFVEVESSKTDYNILRKDLSHYLLKNFSENVDAEYPQKIFETGKIFEGINERENLAIAMTPANFTDIKQVFNYFFSMLGIKFEILSAENTPSYFIDGRAGEIKFNGKVIGYIGEIHPRILKNWRIKMPVALLEIGLENVFNTENKSKLLPFRQ